MRETREEDDGLRNFSWQNDGLLHERVNLWLQNGQPTYSAARDAKVVCAPKPRSTCKRA